MSALEDLFNEQLQDIYYAEKHIVKALPKMAKKATSAALRSGFEKHLKETEGQIGRLEKVFEIVGKKPRGKRCAAIDGILEEGSEIIEEHDRGAGLDAAMAAAAQAVEHYEMARYGTLVSWATDLGMEKAAALLQQTLDQEEATDAALTKLATSELNAAAMVAEDEDEPSSSQKIKKRAA